MPKREYIGDFDPSSIMDIWRVGSRSWSWEDEAADLVSRPRFAEIVDEIYKQGDVLPILVSLQTFRVLDGHHRVLASHLLGWRKIPVEAYIEDENDGSLGYPVGLGVGAKEESPTDT